MKRLHFFHDWTEWKKTSEGVINKETYGPSGENLGKKEIGNYVDQQRKCKTCGKIQMSKEKITIGDI